MSTLKKLLIITYYWPPAGGPGVQRWLKLTKYLIALGYDLHILTLDPEKANYPLVDNSLDELDPSSYSLYRTDNFDIFNALKKFNKKAEYPYSGFANHKKISFLGKVIRVIRSHFFIPDPRKGWNKYAIAQAKNIIEEKNITHVITTSPPHSSQLIGLNLKKHFSHIKWFADLRDPWTDIYYYKEFFHSKWSASRDLSYEKEVIKYCDKLFVVGPHMKLLFANKYGIEIENKTEVIMNGYDASEINSSNTPSEDKYTIGYTGTLAKSYSIEGFLTALEKLKEFHSQLEVRFTGKIDPDYIDYIQKSSLKDIFIFKEHVSHSEAIDQMHESNLLLLGIPRHAHNKLHVSGKIFEYLASKRKIICIGPVDGDPALILKSVDAGSSYDYDDIEGIQEFLKKELQNWSQDKKNYQIESETSQYTRSKIAEKVASIIESESI